jgi:hypothetical protein
MKLSGPVPLPFRMICHQAARPIFQRKVRWDSQVSMRPTHNFSQYPIVNVFRTRTRSVSFPNLLNLSRLYNLLCFLPVYLMHILFQYALANNSRASAMLKQFMGPGSRHKIATEFSKDSLPANHNVLLAGRYILWWPSTCA